jgi:hypothetical protein
MHIKVQVASVVAALLLGGAVAAAQFANESGRALAGAPEDIAAAVIANNELGSGLGTVQIRINHWSTDADRTQLFTALRESGPQALLKALQKMPSVGTIRTPSSVGYNLHYARQSAVGDGRRIVIATDRPMDFWEATNQGRSVDYPFTIIQMQLDQNGKGTGTMSYATKIEANDDLVILEDIASTPFRLTNVQAKPRK